MAWNNVNFLIVVLPSTLPTLQKMSLILGIVVNNPHFVFVIAKVNNILYLVISVYMPMCFFIIELVRGFPGVVNDPVVDVVFSKTLVI